jgi:hypothetical protein
VSGAGLRRRRPTFCRNVIALRFIVYVLRNREKIGSAATGPFLCSVSKLGLTIELPIPDGGNRLDDPALLVGLEGPLSYPHHGLYSFLIHQRLAGILSAFLLFVLLYSGYNRAGYDRLKLIGGEDYYRGFHNGKGFYCHDPVPYGATGWAVVYSGLATSWLTDGV